MTVREFVQKIKDGVFNTKDETVFLRHKITQYACTTSDLSKRIQRCGRFLEGIKNDYVLDNFTVSYKNINPGYKKMYEQIDFIPVNSGEDWFSVIMILGNHNSVDYQFGVNGKIWPAKDAWEVWRKINERY